MRGVVIVLAASRELVARLAVAAGIFALARYS